MNEPITIRAASLADMDTVRAIDDDAGTLFETIGLHFSIGPEHPYARAEYACWREAVESGTAFLAESAEGVALGLLIMNHVDGAPHLEQLDVRRAGMGRGLGRRLLRQAIAWAGERELWLTTYAHVPWNRAFYEQEGFVVVPEPQCGPQMREILAEQRRSLPAPEQRVAMRRSHSATSL